MVGLVWLLLFGLKIADTEVELSQHVRLSPSVSSVLLNQCRAPCLLASFQPAGSSTLGSTKTRYYEHVNSTC